MCVGEHREGGVFVLLFKVLQWVLYQRNTASVLFQPDLELYDGSMSIEASASQYEAHIFYQQYKNDSTLGSYEVLE